jgi:hypothetical protein
LAGANLTGAKLAGANLTGANLADAYLTYADLTGADLTDADLTGANLADANLTGADLTDADLSGAYLAGAKLAGANLTGANLADANLTGAYLGDADLTGADLTDANLTGAKLAGAYLTGANLAGAKFGDVPVIENIHQAVYNAASQTDALDMGSWHCGTAHCRAGWVVTLAGEAGKELENKVGTPSAAVAIYLASDKNRFTESGEKLPNFYCENSEALADMKRLADLEAQGC